MKIKTIVKRPWPHYIFIGGYIIAPFANILLLTVFADLSLSVIFSRMWRGYGPLATIWLFSAPLIGISLIFVHKATWYAFLAHSSLILIDFLIKWISRPGYYASTVDGTMNILILSGNLILIIIIGYIVQRDFRAPYFQVLQRHWREKRRIPIRHCILVDGEEFEISDLSAAGCFIINNLFDFNPGDTMTVDLIARDFHFQSEGRVMRVAKAGIGIMFTKLSIGKKRELTQFLKLRFSLRYIAGFPGVWTKRAAKLDVIIQDISNGGCYLEAPVAHMKTGMDCELSFSVNEHTFEVSGFIAWINERGEFGKPVGFGLTFRPRQYLMMRHLVKHHNVLTLTR
jgi:hypothetical protein